MCCPFTAGLTPFQQFAHLRDFFHPNQQDSRRPPLPLVIARPSSCSVGRLAAMTMVRIGLSSSPMCPRYTAGVFITSDVHPATRPFVDTNCIRIRPGITSIVAITGIRPQIIPKHLTGSDQLNCESTVNDNVFLMAAAPTLTWELGPR
jgi:hypothetical protein